MEGAGYGVVVRRATGEREGRAGMTATGNVGVGDDSNAKQRRQRSDKQQDNDAHSNIPLKSSR